MSLIIQRETTEYLFTGITGDVPSVGAEVAFLDAGQRPDTGDWEDAEVVTDAHELWNDASGSGLKGDYYVAILIGEFGTQGIVLPPGDYQVWVRLTDDVERPVRITPTALEVQ